MSVRRTVAQSGAGLMLLAAIAFGPAATFAAPGGPSDGGGGEGPPQTECRTDSSGDFAPVLSISATDAAPEDTVELVADCLHARGAISASVVLPGGDTVDPEGGGGATPGGQQTWTYTVPDDAAEGSYSFLLSMKNGWSDNRTFSVEADDQGDDQNPPPNGEEDENDPTPTPPPDDEGEDGSAEQGGDEQDSGGEGGSGADDGQGPEAGNGSVDNDGDSEGRRGAGNGEGEDRGAGDDGNSRDDSQQDGSSEDGDTSASAGDDDAASQDPAPQPPAAPGSATNDFPGSTPEPTADQQQSAALAVLMTSLFANGVSSGQVGTTPAEARSVIDPSADASEIEVPAEGPSDAGGASEDGASSGASDDDGLAATGSNLLVPAGIAGLAILAGAGLKIHQLRRER